MPDDAGFEGPDFGEFLAHLDSDGNGQLLQDHLLSVSESARFKANKIGIGAAGSLIGQLHDVGKYSRSFQRYLRNLGPEQDIEQPVMRRGMIDHSTAGAQTIWRSLRQGGKQQGAIAEILALCIASHHSGLIDCISPDGEDNLSRRMNKAHKDSHYDEAWSKAQQPMLERRATLLRDPDLINELRSVIVRLCQDDQNETIVHFKVGLLTRFLFSCLIDADRTNTADSSNLVAASLRQGGRYVEWPALVSLLEQKLKSLPIRHPIDSVRKQISETCLSACVRPRGTLSLTVPTGGGKTLASLRFALNHAAQWNMERIVYISPYTSIIDQNAEVVRKILEPPGVEFASVVLEFHSNLTPLKQTWKSKILSENWDAPIVFTTAVQFLEALFGAGTRSVRRMHQLANSVLIFDEIQTLPVRCVHLFNNAVNFLVDQCGASVLLCTATQPLLHQVDPGKGAIRLSENSEITPNVAELFSNMRRCEVYDGRKLRGWNDSEVARLALSETTSAGSCLIIVNTKKEARSIFEQCRAATTEAVFHLSTNMCPAHRMDVMGELKEFIAKGTPVICVSTQLIEAGVDISFGAVIRALAGLDSIAQAAGRCNRHGERETGRVHVINLTSEVPKRLREIRAAQEAGQRTLDENPPAGETRAVDVSNPKLIEKYFRYYFFDRRAEMDYPVEEDKAQRNDTLLNMLAENRIAVAARATKPDIYLRQAFMTAGNAFEPIDAHTQGIVVPYAMEGKAIVSELCAAFDLAKQFSLLKRAQRFTVNVFPNVMKTLQNASAINEVQPGSGIFCLNERYYNFDFGINIDGSEEMEFQNA